MRKIIALGIMLLFLGMTISSTGFNLENQSVKPLSSGNTLYVGGSGTGNYSKIQDAINDSSDGDTVFVYDDSSPYYENVVVYKSISLIGENRDTTTVDGNKNGSVVRITANDVTLNGFTIQNSGFRLLQYQSGICIESNNNFITDNSIKNCKFGFFLNGASNSTISGNIITKTICPNCMYLNKANGNTICGNTFMNLNKNIWLSESSYNKISNNTIITLLQSLYLKNSYHNEISNNNIYSLYGVKCSILSSVTFKFEVPPEVINCKQLAGTNTWSNNYWNRPRFIKIIKTEITIHIIFRNEDHKENFYTFDWNPAQEPYDIGV